MDFVYIKENAQATHQVRTFELETLKLLLRQSRLAPRPLSPRRSELELELLLGVKNESNNFE